MELPHYGMIFVPGQINENANRNQISIFFFHF